MQVLRGEIRNGDKTCTMRMRLERWGARFMPALQCRDGKRVGMANTKEQQSQVFARRAARVSRALWPTNVRRAIATDRIAQTRRRLLLVIMRICGPRARSFPGVLSRTHSPNTPMPLEPPLVRVLETFDLSQSDVEHFIDLPEGGNTGGYSLESWKEAQTSLHRTGRE
jgi:hypothetical protein